MRKMMGLLFVAAFLIAVMPVTAAAESRGSVHVVLDTGDLPVINGAVTLFRVGVRVEEGYRITEAFGGGIISDPDISSDKLALWLSESAAEEGRSLLLDADGNAVFTELDEGLYILVQTERIDGFYPILPVLLTIPNENHWDVQIWREPAPVVTELPKTGQSPIPFFGILGMILSSAGLLICAQKNRKQ